MSKKVLAFIILVGAPLSMLAWLSLIKLLIALYLVAHILLSSHAAPATTPGSMHYGMFYNAYYYGTCVYREPDNCDDI